MGLLAGRASYVRFRVRGQPPRSFNDRHLEKLSEHLAGQQRKASADCVEFGWSAGAHVLDTEFELEKNVVNDALSFSMRIDSQKIPGDLLHAYYQIELKGLSADNPSGFPSGRQKREARELAKDRLEQEAKDGRFLRRKNVQLLWDGQSNELFVASGAGAVIERLLPLFQQTFHHKLDAITSGSMAFELAESRQQTRAADDAMISSFVPAHASSDVAWLSDEASRDFLGNEFLMWLWYRFATEQEAIELSDDSEATIMPARTLALECPRGQTGKESITSDNPTRLPEAQRAVQSGKLPRKLGLMIARQESQYELTVAAENLAVSGGKLPSPEGDTAQVRREERVNQIRHMSETLDLLFDAFINIRFGREWIKELGRIQRWLKSAG